LGFTAEVGRTASSVRSRRCTATQIGEIYEGANEVQKWVIARQIFGRHITE
jgi:alkylation response protein AidB-like acyl-CoA dehydrogenase